MYLGPRYPDTDQLGQPTGTWASAGHPEIIRPLGWLAKRLLLRANKKGPARRRVAKHTA